MQKTSVEIKDQNMLRDVVEYIKDKETCDVFDIINNLDYDPREICKILDSLKTNGKIKFGLMC